MRRKKDIRVDWRADGGALEKAVDRAAPVTISFPENVGQVWKYEEKPRGDARRVRRRCALQQRGAFPRS